MLLTKAQYARYRNISRQAVDDAIKKGLIATTPDGKIQVNDDGQPAPAAKSYPSIAVSRQVEAAYKAKLAEIEYQQTQKRLIEADKVKAKWFELARRARDNLLQVPDRIADIIAAESDASKVYQLLYSEITQALRDLETDAPADSA